MARPSRKFSKNKDLIAGNRLSLFTQHPDWEAATYVHRTLKDNGYEALLAGGCVRDLILGRTPKDFDIATNASPEEVEALFPKTIDVGRKFGVMMVQCGSVSVEVTRFRQDLDYLDGRHPSRVVYGGAKEDSERRDFTINGLFYDIDTKEVWDFVGGQEDLKKKRICAVGKASERFNEDRLRVLRAIRFAAELDFSIEDSTWEALCAQVDKLDVISPERVTEELHRLLISKHPFKGMKLLSDSGALKHLWPEVQIFSSSYYADKLQKAFDVVGSDRRLELRLGLVLILNMDFVFEHLGGSHQGIRDKQLCALRKFRFSKDSLRKVQFAVENYQSLLPLNTASMVLLNTDEDLLYLPLLEVATALGDIPQAKLDEFMTKFIELCGPDGHLPQPLLSGRDLESLGVPHGPIYKEVLKKAHLAQLDGHFSTAKAAKQWASRFLGLGGSHT